MEMGMAECAQVCANVTLTPVWIKLFTLFQTILLALPRHFPHIYVLVSYTVQIMFFVLK